MYYNRIVAYGDSNTAGDEIIDHLLLNVSFEECNNIKRLLTREEFYKKYQLLLENAKNAIGLSSWAGHLANRLNLPFLNKATSGGSLGYACFAIHNDILSGAIADNDLVLVGLPLLERELFFNNGDAYTLMFNSLTEMQAPLLSLYDNNKMIVEYFRSLIVLEHLNLRINIRVQPTAERTLFTEDDFARLNISSDVYEFAKDVWKSSTIFIDKTDSLMEEAPDYIRCGYNHYSYESHIGLANRLYEKYFK